MILFIIGLLLCVLSTLLMLKLNAVRQGVIITIAYYIVYVLVFFRWY